MGILLNEEKSAYGVFKQAMAKSIEGKIEGETISLVQVRHAQLLTGNIACGYL